MIAPSGLPLFVYMSGMFLGWNYPQWREGFLYGLFFFVPPALVVFILLNSPRQRCLPLLACLLLIAALRTSLCLNPDLPQEHLVSYVTGEKVLLEGVLYRPPVVYDNFTQLYFKAKYVRSSCGTKSVNKDSSVAGRAELFVNERRPDLQVGDRLLVEARLKKPRNYGNPGEFDRKSRFFLNRIYVRGSIKAGHLFLLGGDKRYRFQRWIQRVRRRLGEFLTNEEDINVRGVLKVWFLGDRSDISEVLVAAFRSTGLAHLLAISGLHVGLISLFIYNILKALLKRSVRLLLRCSIKKIAAVGSLPWLLFYVLIAGSPVTAVRASTMAVLCVGALLLDRPHALWNALGIAALLILVSDPGALFSVSFWLSFVAVAGLLTAMPWMRSAASKDPLLQDKGGACLWGQFKMALRQLLVVSLTAFVVTAPLTAYFFNKITPLGILANLVVVPLVGWFVLPCGFLTLLIALVSFSAAEPFLKVTSLGVKLVIMLTEAFEQIPGVCLRVGSPTFFELTLFYFSLFLMLKPKGSIWRKRFLPINIIVFVTIVIFGYLQPRWHHGLEITFLSVGQGDSTLIEFPGGKRMLVDGGLAIRNGHDAGKRIIAPFLGRRRICRLDYIVASHGQADHYGGLYYLAQEFRPKELWIGPAAGCEGAGYGEFVNMCARKGIRIRRLCREAGPFFINGVKTEILGPDCKRKDYSPAAGNCSSGVNDLSLVMRLTFGEVSLLLTGDIESKAERELLAAKKDLKALILKVAHHGSQSSSRADFLDAVAPKIAVISAGYGNRFGFPAEVVVRRFREKGIALFRVDLDGAVQINADGDKVTVKPFRGEERTY